MFTSKNFAIAASVVLLATLVYIASFGLWVTRDLADSEKFAESTVAAFELESSRDAISELVVDRLAEGRPLLSVASPLLIDLLSGLLDGARLQSLLTRIAGDLHGIMFDGSQQGIVIDLTNVGAAILPPLEQIFPQLAAEIPDDIFREFVLVEPGTIPELSAYAKAARTLTWVAIILALILGGVMIALRQVKWKGAFAVGLGLAIGGLVSILVIGQSRSITIGIPENPNVEVLLANLYDETARSLKSFSWWILLIGIVVVVGSLIYGNSRQDADGDDIDAPPGASIQASTGSE